MAYTGPKKIMIIRHAEKHGTYYGAEYSGFNAFGEADNANSLVSMGWERAGGIPNLFLPNDGNFKPHLKKPDFIYASSPVVFGQLYDILANGNMLLGDPGISQCSQRPYQTISALLPKIGLPTQVLDISFMADNYCPMPATPEVPANPGMVTSVLANPAETVLIAWQHQYILPETQGADSILNELFWQTNTVARPNPIPLSYKVPIGPWPPNRYDMVFVLNLSSITGTITDFHQVPQMLLYGDIDGHL